jgi:hypothetical protein
MCLDTTRCGCGFAWPDLLCSALLCSDLLLFGGEVEAEKWMDR